MRSLNETQTAQTMMNGMRIYCNFTILHMALKGKTPTEKSGISKIGENKWKALIQKSAKAKIKILIEKPKAFCRIVSFYY